MIELPILSLIPTFKGLSWILVKKMRLKIQTSSKNGKRFAIPRNLFEKEDLINKKKIKKMDYFGYDSFDTNDTNSNDKIPNNELEFQTFIKKYLARENVIEMPEFTKEECQVCFTNQVDCFISRFKIKKDRF